MDVGCVLFVFYFLSIGINNLRITRLKVTLAWDDIPGANLLNDLDIKLISPSGETFYPWVLNASNPSADATRNIEGNLKDDKNVVEQVYASSSDDGFATGQWLIVVSSDSLGDANAQKYSLVSDRKIEIKN